MRYMACSLAGLIAGMLLTLGIMSQQSTSTGSVTSRTDSGSPLQIIDVQHKGKATEISTSYDGAGGSTLTVPDAVVPSARAWDTRHWSAGASISTDKTISVLTGYRWQQLQIIGSLWYRNQTSYTAGAALGIMYIF